ncbi:uncharacterized protein LOC121873675 [Homarus americanus]|uniref:uncharacterized protein LOC121873675 n=1 Tax=Homarus americanus TaxID=6706 RepID=UPI001C486D0D|nr:uncharacterized protein LOC121873675 [Homarus americanus]
MGINVFYISSWLVRRKSFAHISFDEDSKHYEQLFRLTGIGLTLAQLAITVIFCIIAGIFTYKVAEERTRSRKSLHHGAKFRSKKHHSSSAPPLDSYDADDSASIVRVTMDEQFMNQGLHDSTNKLPISGSNGSIDQVGNSDTIRQPTSV